MLDQAGYMAAITTSFFGGQTLVKHDIGAAAQRDLLASPQAARGATRQLSAELDG
jgi:hypothetical protein